jgi:hypothetical protein
MTKYDLYDWYIENMVDELKGEIPLSFKEWEREIYPSDVEFLRTIK